MQKKTKTIILIVVTTIVALGLVIYFFFPKIWGNVLYPLKYEEYIVKYAKEYDVDPAFVAAIIFSESRFNADAVSGAGARGLMQVIPSTAQGIANSLGESSFDLHDPETSIRYGTWYIKDLLNRYDNDMEAALAGYNGGPAVANRYIVTRSDAVIPLETAGYLRTVMGAYEKYKELYYKELYTQGVAAENVAEQLKVEEPEPEQSWWQRILESVRDVTQ